MGQATPEVTQESPASSCKDEGIPQRAAGEEIRGQREWRFLDELQDPSGSTDVSATEDVPKIDIGLPRFNAKHHHLIRGLGQFLDRRLSRCRQPVVIGEEVIGRQK